MTFIVIFMMLWERPFSWTVSILFSRHFLIEQKHIRGQSEALGTYMYIQVNTKEQILFLRGGGDFVVLKLQPVNLKRFLAVTNRYQHGQVYLTTKGRYDSRE